MEEKITEKQSSIKISRNTKGQYTWDIKVYFDDDKKTQDDIVTYIEDLNNKVKTNFIGG